MSTSVFIHSFRQIFIENLQCAKHYANSQRYNRKYTWALTFMYLEADGDTEKETGLVKMNNLVRYKVHLRLHEVHLNRCIKLYYSNFKDSPYDGLQLFLL